MVRGSRQLLSCAEAAPHAQAASLCRVEERALARCSIDLVNQALSAFALFAGKQLYRYLHYLHYLHYLRCSRLKPLIVELFCIPLAVVSLLTGGV